MFNKVFRYLYSKKIDLHSDILSLKEIQTAIKSVVETHEDKFLTQLKNDQYNPKLWLKIKHQYIHVDDAIKYLKAVGNNYQSQTNNLITKTQTTQELVKNDIYNYFIKYFTNRTDKLTFKQIAIILEQYAYVKRFDQEFFRTMENEIYDRLSEKDEIIHYQDIEKILWAYQYCHAGSAILYNQLARIIKIAQHEINPIKLAYYSYLYSKCPDNQKGGFGVYALTEKQLMTRINDYTFQDFVKLATYIFSRNILSNALQIQIEEQIAENFPTNKNLNPSDLVKLCKSTINYYFKYNDKSLYHKIEGACIDLIDQINDKQFCEILWSFLKSRKGNAELYEKFLNQIKYRQNMFTFRQLALLYLNSSNNPETHEITKLLNQIISKKIEWGKIEIKPIYLAYITMASMQSKQQLPLKLDEVHLKMLSISMKLAILQTLQACLPNQEQILLSISIIKDLQNCQLEYEDQVILNYCESYFYKFCTFNTLQIKPTIHRQLFYQAFYLQPTNENFHNQLLVLEQQYKNEMRFFFKQDHFIVIAWSLLSQYLLNEEKIIKQELIKESCLGIKELNINAITNIEKYIQTLWMSILIEKLKINIGISRIQQYNNIQNLAQTTVLMNNFNDKQLKEISKLLDNVIQTQCEEINLKYQKFQSYINMFDQDFGMMIPVANLIKTKNQILKFGLIILEKHDFDQKSQLQNIQQLLGEGDQQIQNQIKLEKRITKLLLEKLFNWNIEYIYLDEFTKMNQIQQSQYLRQIFALNPLDQEEVKEYKEKQQKRKSLSFKEKLGFQQQKKQNLYAEDQLNELEIEEEN